MQSEIIDNLKDKIELSTLKKIIETQESNDNNYAIVNSEDASNNV
jgi:hypothetical protein